MGRGRLRSVVRDRNARLVVDVGIQDILVDDDPSAYKAILTGASHILERHAMRRWHRYVLEEWWDHAGAQFREGQVLERLVIGEGAASQPFTGEGAIDHLGLGSVRSSGGMVLELTDTGDWAEVTRDCLLEGLGQGGSIRRLFVTADAGVGKTANMRWLWQAITKRGLDLALGGDTSGLVFAFPIDFSELLARGSLIDYLRHQLFAPENGGDAALLSDVHRQILSTACDEGRIVLLMDALDHGMTEQQLKLLRYELTKWSRCRVVFSGRLYALHK
jgi:hypothetical protein